MTSQFIEDHAQQWPVARMGSTLGVSASGSYAWRHRRPSPRDQQDQGSRFGRFTSRATQRMAVPVFMPRCRHVECAVAANE
jgi:hypothetical protein